MKRVALAAVLVVAAGCGGDERLPELAAEADSGRDREAIARVITDFVAAAQAGDVDRMRSLLTPATSASFGAGALEEVADDLLELRGLRVVLARPLDEGWSVAAVAGENEEGEPVAWAAALHSGGVELGGLFFSRLKPDPASETGARPEIRVEAQAGDEVDDVRVWVDGSELRAHAFRRAPFTREVWGRLAGPLPDGPHTIVVFAAAGDTAGAFAWPFEVED